MGRASKRSRRESRSNPPPDDKDPPLAESSDSDSIGEPTREQKKHREESPADKYNVFKVPGYNRKYPENSKKSDFIVFLSHTDENLSFTDKDRLGLSKGIREHCVAGVLHLRSINRYKVGITFDQANNANMFIQNKKLLQELSLKASIPANDTEVTGVITSVPIDLSNKKIYTLLGISKNIVQVRRFMRRVRSDSGVVSFQPTQTVAVTFASTQLPEYVYLDSWRHEVNIYVPPVKQCLKCLRYGHIAKFCKNSDACSICSENHNFKNCTADKNNPKCANCQGSHLAISASCPLKKQKIEENRIKSRAVRYSDLFDESSFPLLGSRSIENQINNLIKSNIFMNLMVESITKIITNKDTVPINSNNIRDILQQTLSKKSPIRN